jgi:GT2 family glycosyltransferase
MPRSFGHDTIGLTHHELINVSAVVATTSRAGPLGRTLQNLVKQSSHPFEIIFVDASDDSRTREICEIGVPGLRSKIHWTRAKNIGAGVQRNQGVLIAAQDIIWFFDDDIVFEQDCVSGLWNALRGDDDLGGVSALISNQRYQQPGALSRFMFTLMNGRAEKSFAGKVIGPAVNLLPEDHADLPEVVPVEWLNTTCTMYRREALPNPPFDSFFEGYSFMEDVALSLRVSQGGWKLANVRTAKIFHDSQSGDHKADIADRSRMELANRHYIMEEILRKRSSLDYARLALWELFTISSTLASPSGWKKILPMISGKWSALRQLLVRNSK